MVVNMTDMSVLDGSGKEGSTSDEDATLHGEDADLRNAAAEQLTTENVFNLAIALLRELGYDCLSEDRSEDFTGRIDGVLRKSDSYGGGESSGYLRILSVYRSGQKIRVELYNFLKTFPTDSLEMKEISESLRRLFEKEQSVELDIHE